MLFTCREEQLAVITRALSAGGWWGRAECQTDGGEEEKHTSGQRGTSGQEDGLEDGHPTKRNWKVPRSPDLTGERVLRRVFTQGVDGDQLLLRRK